jgi:anti-sigma factor RsiW
LIEHLTQNQVDDYCRQRLRRADLLPVSDHLDECEACRRRIEIAMNGDAAFLTLRSEVFGEAAEISSPNFAFAHPTSEQTNGYVDEILSGEELQIVTDHLTHCEQCTLAIDDLRAFRNQIAPSLEREYHPAPVSFSTEGWWHRTVASLLAPFRTSPGLAYGAALTVLLVGVTGWLVWTLRDRPPKQEVVVVPTPPSPPAQVPAAAPPPAQLVAQLNDGEHHLTLDQEGNLSGADI